jgi:hypothetical protein
MLQLSSRRGKADAVEEETHAEVPIATAGAILISQWINNLIVGIQDGEGPNLVRDVDLHSFHYCHLLLTRALNLISSVSWGLKVPKDVLGEGPLPCEEPVVRGM